MDPIDPTAGLGTRHDHRVAQIQRHAIWLERIAAMLLGFAATAAAVALAATFAAWLALGVLLAGAVAWGLVRALALRADEAALLQCRPDPVA